MKTISMWKNVGWFTPPKIAREYLPLKSSVRFTLKSSVWFTPPKIAFISTFLPPKSDIN